MAAKTYSNGAEQVECVHITTSGCNHRADLRIEDNFFCAESGFLDAPDLISAGSTLKSVIRGTTPATVPKIALRN